MSTNSNSNLDIVTWEGVNYVRTYTDNNVAKYEIYTGQVQYVDSTGEDLDGDGVADGPQPVQPVQVDPNSSSSAIGNVNALFMEQVPKINDEYTIYTGDTAIPVVLMTGTTAMGERMTALNKDDWLCRVQLLDQWYCRVGSNRLITEVFEHGTAENGTAFYVAKLKRAESQQLKAYNRLGRKFYFSVTLSNDNLDYQHSVEVPFRVFPKP